MITDSAFRLELKNQWPGFGILDGQLVSMAKQLGCDHPHFPAAATMHFRSAEKLLILTCYEFFLLPYVFLQTVFGLEKVMRSCFPDEQGKCSLKELLKNAVDQKLITDSSFSDYPSVLKLDGICFRLAKTDDKLAHLIPDLRNKIAHGDYTLTPELLPLALQVRALANEVADRIPCKLKCSPKDLPPSLGAGAPEC